MALHGLTFGEPGSAIFYHVADPAPRMPGDFDDDADVDGRDFLVWQRGNSPNPLSGGDLDDWRANYGTGSLSAIAAVPEPNCIGLIVGMNVLRFRRR